MIKLRSISELKNLLTNNGIDISNWGTGTAKTVENLWQELQDGDAILIEDPLYRSINFVQIIIRENGQILIEAEQVMANGSRRMRNKPPSEKMQLGETVEEAAIRGIQQELDRNSENISIIMTFDQAQKILRPSPSYPGLETVYTVYTVEAKVYGLPESDFTSEENSPTDPVRKHFWDWVPEKEAQKLF